MPGLAAAIKLAQAGKIHGKTYKEYLRKRDIELERAIRSLQRRIEEHRDKVANSQNYYADWHTFPEKRVRDKLRHWREEIKNFTEQQDIFKGILKNRDR